MAIDEPPMIDTIRPGEMYFTAEVAKLFRVTPQTVRNWSRRGTLSTRRVGVNGRRMYDGGEILRLYRAGVSELESRPEPTPAQERRTAEKAAKRLERFKKQRKKQQAKI